ncbi:MAG: DUF5597 domain-containing protein, partial [Planctomycetota bacterium]
DGSLQDQTLCPNEEAARERDMAAFRRVMAYLRENDEQRTVILMQVENESGIMGAARCHCPRCEERMAARDWSAYGSGADEAFAAWSLASYLDAVAAAGKEEYPLPMYANAALGGGGGARPGLDYFSGGPMARWLDLWKEAAPHLDFLAPDIYGHSYPTFNRHCADFTQNGNPLFIAETSTCAGGRTEVNVFYAIGEYGAIGFDPWAIDRSFPDWWSPPLVRRHDLAWSDRTLALRDSYVAIGRALRQVASAAGTPELAYWVQEPGDRGGTSFHLGGADWRVRYPVHDGTARGMVIERGQGEFVVLGVCSTVHPVTPAPEGRPLKVLSVERGEFRGDQWVRHARLTREIPLGERPLKLEEGTVLRVRLDL